MSVNIFNKNKLNTADELYPVATVDNQKVYVGTKSSVSAALDDNNIKENSVVYITDDNNNEKKDLVDKVPVGTIIPYAGKISPENYLLCDGKSFDQNAYPELFNLLGSNITPNLAGRFLMGNGSESTGTFVNESLPDHKHILNDPGHKHNHKYNKRRAKKMKYSNPQDNLFTADIKIKTSGSKTGVTIEGVDKMYNEAGELIENTSFAKGSKVIPDSYVVTYIIKAK